MTKALTTTTHSPLPPAQTRAAANLLAVYRNSLERSPTGRCSISSAAAPAGADRAALERRLAVLEDALAPGDPDEILRLITAMRLGFAARQESERDAERTSKLYASQVAKFPAWAVRAACERLMRAHKSEFMPSIPKVYAACVEAVADWRIERQRIVELLAAEVYEPAPRVAKERVAELVASVRAGAEMARAKDTLKEQPK